MALASLTTFGQAEDYFIQYGEFEKELGLTT